MIKKRLPVTEKKSPFRIFPVVAGLAFCLLAGCGGGGGATVSDSSASLLPDDVGRGYPSGPPGTPGPPPALIDLFNEDKFSLIKARQAWFSGGRVDVYTGKNVVIGIMEEVNSLHESFQNRDGQPSKIHEASVLTSPYPVSSTNSRSRGTVPNPPTPEEKFIVDMKDFTEYPDEPCLLEYGLACPVQDGSQKYFLRLPDGKLGLLPGLQSSRTPPVFPSGCDENSDNKCSRVLYGTWHGTGVASVAAANPGEIELQGEDGPRPFRGVAYDARILVYARPVNIAGVAAPVSLQAAYFENAPKEADVYNYSHSSVTKVESNSEEIRKSDNPFYRIAKAIEKMGTPFISSAGNSGKDGEVLPRFPAALPLFFPNLRGQVLAVTATDDAGGIASYANRCGELPSDWDAAQHGRHYCLAAPGGDEGSGFLVAGRKEDDESLVSGRGQNDEYDRAIGTSLSAPVVTGAFAIVKEWFRNPDGSDSMSNRNLILRLVNTANNRGQYSDVAIYGAGLLDLDAAISAVGNTSVSAAGNMDDGIVYDFDATSLSVSAAFGDALQRALQTREIAAFDELGAPFWHPLASLTATTSNRETLRKRQARLLERADAPVETAFGGRLALASTRIGPSEQIDMSLRQPVDSIAQTELLLTAGDLSTAPLGLHDDKSFAHPYLHFAGEGVGLGGSLQLGAGRLAAMGFTSGSASVSRDIPVEARGGLIEYTLEPFAGVELGVQAGAMVEESRALGLLSEGGFGEMGESSTAFAGVSLDGTLEDSWRFRASMLFGRTNLDTPPVGLLATSSSLASSAFRFALEGSDVLLDADRMDVFVAQPLRIEGGEADFVIPVARTPSGSITRERISGVSLEPGGRELEFGARYEMQVREDVIATGGVGIVHEGGHSKRQETEFYGLANLRIDF